MGCCCNPLYPASWTSADLLQLRRIFSVRRVEWCNLDLIPSRDSGPCLWLDAGICFGKLRLETLIEFAALVAVAGVTN